MDSMHDPIVRPCKPYIDISGLTEFGATARIARVAHIVVPEICSERKRRKTNRNSMKQKQKTPVRTGAVG